MRVFEHGYMEVEIKTTCSKCSCDFIYRPKNVREHIDYDFKTHIGRAYRYIVCPECGEECIYTNPITKRIYNDDLVGTPNNQDNSPDKILSDVTYDGGDENNETKTDTPIEDGGEG